MRPSPAAGPPRRAVLASLVAGLTLSLTGCADLSRLGDVRLDDDETVPPPVPGPDELARRAAVADARVLRDAAGAAAASAGDPALAGLLKQVADVHAVHLEALAAREPAPTPTAAPSAAPSAAPTTAPPVPPPVGELPGRESAAAVRALGHVPEVSGGMARLLAAVGAARSACADVVARTAGTPPPATPALVTEATRTTWSEGLDADAVTALTAATEAAHAAVYGYGVVAARLTGAAQEAARAALADHEAAVAQLRDVLVGAGHEPPVPEVAYALPGPAGTPAELVELAAGIERRLAGHYAPVAAATGGVRLLGADLLAGTAVREVRWTGTPTALPGLH